jgi:coenzyme F420-reducing hydrogenase delta subunit
MKIIAFVCNWSCNMVTDTDTVGPVRLVRVLCSGRISPGTILKAFESGADGVIGFGCQDDACHYASGNDQAKKNFDTASELLHLLGIGPARLRFEQVSPDDTPNFEEVVKSFADSLGE